ncbi:G-protein coupled receptor 84-like [Suncus etruscus]|uniref:G-protein coupled receptor 84-like n=1 Tax=Suncus etruscus TaxID=109475 RepID=UPI00210F9720|nr:G-protein coupled receptor 84-like [Suncus etruscus]
MPNISDANFSCCHESVLGYRYVVVIWGIVVTVTGTIGNVLTLLALAIQPKLRTRFNLLIANLSLADLLYCTFLQPFSVDTYLHLRWRTGITFCRIFGFLITTSNSVSVLTLCLIALGRYLLTVHPNLFPRVFSAKGMVLALVGTWVVGIASLAPFWRFYVLVPVVCTCSFDRDHGQPYSTVLLSIYFVLGLSSMGIFYCLIHHQVKRAARALDQYKLHQASTHSSHVDGTDEAIPGCFVDQVVLGGLREEISSEPVSIVTVQMQEGNSAEMEKESHSKRAKQTAEKSSPEAKPKNRAQKAQNAPSEFGNVTRMCFAVFLCFALSFIPFWLINILDTKRKAPRIAYMFASNLTWLNSCINPVLYAAMNRQFRQAYISVLKRGSQSFRRLR